MSITYQKVKSVAKQVRVKGPGLNKVVLDTMKTISDIVGATLGPGGQPVLIERQEHDLPAMITKDGVTVFRSLGLDDPSAHCIMEAARDAAVRTASEAGDGTTTATVLAEAIVRNANDFMKKNPRVSPQKIVRKLESAFRTIIEPTIKAETVLAGDWSNEQGRNLLRSVAKISANGDEPLADAVIQCFDLVGDDGNVTIAEISGPSRYEVERIEGYPIPGGYEDSCTKFYPKFINDTANQRCALENPLFLIYHGRITEIQSLIFILESVGRVWNANPSERHNVVVVATGFSESVLGHLALNFAEPSTINVYPLLAPQSPMANGQLQFLEDLAAVTGARVLDAISCPLDQATIEDLGADANFFEAYRFRSTVIGQSNEEEIILRVDELRAQAENAASDLDRILLQERIGKLTGGIAKLKVIGVSNGELKEKRDRAEDAVCAVRGAIKHGCLPGGGWMLLKLMSELRKSDDPILTSVLIPSLFEPVTRLFRNCGFDELETQAILEPIIKTVADGEKPLVYDALEGKIVDPFVGGVLDSTPAVLEAIRNSISIASLLGTLGGTVVFKRDLNLELSEAKSTAEFVRNSEDVNEANLRP